MARYKKRPKVKRYRRSFYTPAMKLRMGASIAVLVLVVLGLAWLAAPHVLDWATHTWYTVVRNRDLDAESATASSEAQEPDAASPAASSQPVLAASSEPQPEPAGPETSEPQDDTEVLPGRWAVLEPATLADEAKTQAAARQLAAQGVRYALVRLKDGEGRCYYRSAVPAAAGSTAQPVLEPDRIAAILRDSGLVPVAQLAAFKDPVAAYADRAMAIRYRSQEEADYLWLDAANAAAGGKPWLNPYAESAVQYVGDLVAEVHGMGFDQVVLEYVQFPAAVSKKQDFGVTGGVDRAGRLAAAIAAWQTRFEGEVTLWLAYPLASCTDAPSALGAAAPELGMKNLLVTLPSGSGLDEEGRGELAGRLTAQGVEHVVLRDDAAGYFA